MSFVCLSDVVFFFAINRKQVRKVLDNGLKPILCIGESKEEYESGLNKEVRIRYRYRSSYYP